MTAIRDRLHVSLFKQCRSSLRKTEKDRLAKANLSCCLGFSQSVTESYDTAEDRLMSSH